VTACGVTNIGSVSRLNVFEQTFPAPIASIATSANATTEATLPTLQARSSASTMSEPIKLTDHATDVPIVHRSETGTAVFVG
jgi:hypothetical protein